MRAAKEESDEGLRRVELEKERLQMEYEAILEERGSKIKEEEAVIAEMEALKVELKELREEMLGARKGEEEAMAEGARYKEALEILQDQNEVQRRTLHIHT